VTQSWSNHNRDRGGRRRGGRGRWPEQLHILHLLCLGGWRPVASSRGSIMTWLQPYDGLSSSGEKHAITVPRPSTKRPLICVIEIELPPRRTGQRSRTCDRAQGPGIGSAALFSAGSVSACVCGLLTSPTERKAGCRPRS
jgi:hypothetical protein